MKIEKDVHGRDVVWAELGGRPVPLPAENILLSAETGHILIAPLGLQAALAGKGLTRPRPHEIAMIEFYLEKKGDTIIPDVFTGEPKVHIEEE